MPPRPPDTQIGRLLDIPVGQIDRNPDQPRRRIDQEALVGLASSLRESGIIEPVIVRPRNDRYQLVAGERRWRAAIMIGRETIPAIVRDDLDDAAAHELAVIENMARRDLSPIEEARSIALLCDTRGLSKAEIGRRVGRSREAISNLVRLLDLPDEAQALIDAGRLSEGHGRALMLCDDHDERRRLARRAGAEDWSVRELELAARGRPAPPRKPASGPHPDLAELAERLHERFSDALKRDVQIAPRPSGTLRLTLELTGHADAEGLLATLTTGAQPAAVDGVIAVDPYHLEPANRWGGDPRGPSGST
jgi:ParB family transcriptional regulator, chromosome partitioning protein